MSDRSTIFIYNQNCLLETDFTLYLPIQSHNVDVVLIYAMCIFVEHAGQLLKKAFNVGIHNKLETVSFINDTLQLLNMETI